MSFCSLARGGRWTTEAGRTRRGNLSVTEKKRKLKGGEKSRRTIPTAVEEGKGQARYRCTERPQRGSDQEGPAPVITGWRFSFVRTVCGETRVSLPWTFGEPLALGENKNNSLEVTCTVIATKANPFLLNSEKDECVRSDTGYVSWKTMWRQCHRSGWRKGVGNGRLSY